MLTKNEEYFKKLIKDVLESHHINLSKRPLYKDGRNAYSKYLTHKVFKFDLSKGDFPITQLRPIAWKSAIKEVMWIYQKQSNVLDELHKMGVYYWDSWDIGDGTIGERYGAVVKKYDIIINLLKNLKSAKFNRRNVINLWDYEGFSNTKGLYPCAFMSMFEVRELGDKTYLDCMLVQRSSDMLVALHINQIQYVALQMMIACHFGWEVGKFTHIVNNLHIYDNQFNQAEELLKREIPQSKPILKLNCEKGTNFYNIDFDDFELVDYDPLKPQLKFDLAI